ncbi:hypothetical protein CEP54_000967 [Fusarium duplospermum]|uniref:Uncharacterized protein n=1 Tax=Fusarium duplospermum TaxID=1325734 RepID=A0A428R4C3_9HYPO|nr:hypothetical protein CEP54_000967 [Fusarium duplospermum]
MAYTTVVSWQGGGSIKRNHILAYLCIHNSHHHRCPNHHNRRGHHHQHLHCNQDALNPRQNGDFNGPPANTEHWSLLQKDNSWISVGGISNDWSYSLGFGTGSFTDDYVYQEINAGCLIPDTERGWMPRRAPGMLFGEDGAFAGLGDKLQVSGAVNGGTEFKRIMATCQWTEEQLAQGLARVLFNFRCTQNFGWIDNIKFDFKTHDPERCQGKGFKPVVGCVYWCSS